MAGRKKTVATKVDERGKEIIKALQSFEEAKGLGVDVVCNALEEALVNAYQKSVSDESVFGSDERALARASVNQVTGEIKLFNQKRVVEEVEDDFFEISLEDARETNPELNVGDLYEIPVCIDNFVRATAMHVKTVLKQKVREAERANIMNEFSDKQDEMVTGLVSMEDVKNYYIDLGKTQGILPKSEIIPGETIKMGSSIKVYITKVDSGTKGPLILLSRKHYGFVKRLFELEIPEVRDGIILIYSVARDAGNRTKIAVYSENPNVEAVGSCIGERGSRINNIIKELNGEKIDVVEYSNDSARFIENALSPAKNLTVVLGGEKENEALVIVDDENLSLAIGKKGQNVRLAARLTHYKIDVKTRSEAREMGINIL